MGGMSALLGMIIFAIGMGRELVAQGAEGIIAALCVPALFMCVIVSPAVIEQEEIIRQAVPLTHLVKHSCFSLHTLNLPDQHGAKRSQQSRQDEEDRVTVKHRNHQRGCCGAHHLR